MTDNEIIEALERCSQHTECCYCNSLEECGNKRILTTSVFDLINRQKAEIDRLKKEVEDKERAYNDEFCLRKEWQSKCRELLKEKQITESEVIKDFVERLKEGIQENHYYTSTEDMGYRKRYVHITNIKDFSQYIDNLVKERTEVKERGGEK